MTDDTLPPGAMGSLFVGLVLSLMTAGFYLNGQAQYSIMAAAGLIILVLGYSVIQA